MRRGAKITVLPGLGAPLKPIKPVANHWEKSPEERAKLLKEGGPKAKAKVTREIRSFVNERNDILRALDLARMIAFFLKHNKILPDDWAHPTVPYAMMHKARLAITDFFTDEERKLSRAWLTMHGYSHSLLANERPQPQHQPQQEPTQ